MKAFARTPTVVCPHPVRCAGARTHRAGSAAATACRTGGASTNGPALAPTPPPPLQADVGARAEVEVAPSPAAAAGHDEPEVAAAMHHRMRELHAGLTHGDAMGAYELAAQQVWTLEDVVGEALAQRDRADGWDPKSGQPHPSGGYTEREVHVNDNGEGTFVSVRYLREGARYSESHREDGPAFVIYDSNGHLTRWQHNLGGRVHREDGPAEWRAGKTDRGAGRVDFAYHDGDEGPDGLRWWDKVPAGVERMNVLVAQGASSQEIARWLHFESLVGRRATRALLAAGVGARSAVDCARAGVGEAKTIIAVSRGELPLSWAVAGAGVRS